MQRSALCRSRRELSNAYFVAKFGLDTAENEPCQVCPIELGLRGLHPVPPRLSRTAPTCSDFLSGDRLAAPDFPELHRPSEPNLLTEGRAVHPKKNHTNSSMVTIITMYVLHYSRLLLPCYACCVRCVPLSLRIDSCAMPLYCVT